MLRLKWTDFVAYCGINTCIESGCNNRSFLVSFGSAYHVAAIIRPVKIRLLDSCDVTFYENKIESENRRIRIVLIVERCDSILILIDLWRIDCSYSTWLLRQC